MITSKARKNILTGLAFISPWLIGFLAFSLYPMLSSLYYSLTDFNVISDPEFVGLRNYLHLFTRDRSYMTVLRNSAYMLLVGVPITIFASVCIAVLLNNRKVRGTQIYRAVFFLPTLVPTVILCILWTWMFQPENGLINVFLRLLGIQGPGWFNSQLWSKPALILMTVWCSGNYILLFSAGLQDIDNALYEAVEIDGGNFFHKAWYIMLPSLKPIILFNLISAIINSLQYFAEPFIITQGGPNNKTLLYALYIYQNAFMYNKMGYASAMSWILLVVAVLLSVILVKTMKWGGAE